MDTKPRKLSKKEAEVLADMGRWVEYELELQRELDHAAEVQRVLLPHAVPDLPGYELAGRCLPSRALGGDFFAWDALPDGKFQLHVADVMGKGIPAALIAASLRATLIAASQFNDQGQAIQRSAAGMEQLLSDTGSFVTVFSARLEPSTGRIEYVDAGHGLAFVFSAGGYRRLLPSGPPLGVLADHRWDVHSTVLEPGETLIVVSDGYLDFFPTLEETLRQALGAGVGSLRPEELVDRAAAFSALKGHEDDVTILALRRL
jgi:serine phosphatase RsbU (regulator of sigma subunit)